MKLSSKISRFCAVHRNRSYVALFNSMVYKISNTLQYVTCDVRTYVKHSVLLQYTNVIDVFRVSVIRSAKAVCNERTASCADVCVLKGTELTVQGVDTPDAPHYKHAVCIQLKKSTESQDSNASFQVKSAYLWRISCGKPVCGEAIKCRCFYSNSWRAKRTHVG